MTLPELLRELDRLGAWVVVADGRRGVKCPAVNSERLAQLVGWLRKYGDAVVAHYSGKENCGGWHCDTCNSWWYTDATSEIARLCTLRAAPRPRYPGAPGPEAGTYCPHRPAE